MSLVARVQQGTVDIVKGQLLRQVSHDLDLHSWSWSPTARPALSSKNELDRFLRLGDHPAFAESCAAEPRQAGIVANVPAAEGLLVNVHVLDPKLGNRGRHDRRQGAAD